MKENYFEITKRERVKAAYFFLALFFIFVISVFTSFSSTRLDIIGTEINSDGTVEYMCLGAGCEDISSLGW